MDFTLILLFAQNTRTLNYSNIKPYQITSDVLKWKAIDLRSEFLEFIGLKGPFLNFRLKASLKEIKV